MNRQRLLSLLVTVALVSIPAAASGTANKSENVKLIKQFSYTGSTEVAASGDFVYTGELDGITQRGEKPKKGGMHIFDVSGKTPKEVSFLHCPGNDNDVEVVKPGLVALGFQRNACAPIGTGFMLIDVRDPKDPRTVSHLYLPPGANAHTISPYPGGDYLYVSPGGLRNGAAIEYIADISKPLKPKIAATFEPNEAGCHDLFFFFEKKKKLAFCSGLGETQIWDVADPIAPQVVGRIVNPAIEFHTRGSRAPTASCWRSTMRHSPPTNARRPNRPSAGCGSTTSAIPPSRCRSVASRPSAAATGWGSATISAGLTPGAWRT